MSGNPSKMSWAVATEMIKHKQKLSRTISTIVELYEHKIKWTSTDFKPNILRTYLHVYHIIIVKPIKLQKIEQENVIVFWFGLKKSTWEIFFIE